MAARSELLGVGDAALGEWGEMGDIAFHLRRRLKPAEQALIGPAVDIRGTAEAARRMSRVVPLLPARFVATIPADELVGVQPMAAAITLRPETEGRTIPAQDFANEDYEWGHPPFSWFLRHAEKWGA
jgi:hypothetical protein